MTGTAGCREIRQALGVYVLGAIDPAERAEVDEHLATCLECREELARLAGLPALLRRIPLEEAERLASDGAHGDGGGPSEELLGSLLSRAAAVKRRRRLRGLVAAAAAVVVVLGGGALASRVFAPSAQPPPASSQFWHTVRATSPVTGAHMIVRYRTMSWGTLMSVQVSGIPAGITCQFEITDHTGRRWPVGGWTLTHHGQPPWYPASTSLPEHDMRSFVLTSGGRVLATVPAT